MLEWGQGVPKHFTSDKTLVLGDKTKKNHEHDIMTSSGKMKMHLKNVKTEHPDRKSASYSYPNSAS
jgi:hypothetical protein